MKPSINILLFVALGLAAGGRAALVPRTQALTRNVCDDKPDICDCALVRRVNSEDDLSSQIRPQPAHTEKAKKRKSQADYKRSYRAAKLSIPETAAAMRAKEADSRRRCRAAQRADPEKAAHMKLWRAAEYQRYRAAKEADPGKAAHIKIRQAAAYQRWKIKKTAQQQAATPAGPSTQDLRKVEGRCDRCSGFKIPKNCSMTTRTALKCDQCIHAKRGCYWQGVTRTGVPEFVEVKRKRMGKPSQKKSDIADEIKDPDSDTVKPSDEASSQVHGSTLRPCLSKKVDNVDKGKGKARD
jgi:hypothetical protein